MGKNRQSEISRVDFELPWDGGALKIPLASGKSHSVRLLRPRCWIEIDLVDELGQPAAGEVYRVEMLDGTIVKEDRLDRNGYARVEVLSSEECIISFPLVDADSWSYLGYSE